MKKELSLCLCLYAMLSSCGSGEKSAETVDTISLTSTILINNEALRHPATITVGKDRLYVLNRTTVDTLIDEYMPDGTFVRSFLNKGQGPDEIVSAEDIFYYSQDNSIIINDYMIRGKLMAVEQLSSDKPKLKTIIEFQTETNDSVLPTDLAMPLSNKMYVAGNQPKYGMLGIYNQQGQFVKLVQPYPDATTIGYDIPDFALYNFFRMSGKCSPDGKHFAACSNANILVIGKAEDGYISTISVIGKPQEGIEVINQGDNIAFSYNDKYTSFFPSGVTASNHHFYSVSSGLNDKLRKQWKEMLDGTTEPKCYVRVYDWDGNIVNMLKLDVGQCRLAVSPDDSVLYALTETDEGYSIHKFDLEIFDNREKR